MQILPNIEHPICLPLTRWIPENITLCLFHFPPLTTEAALLQSPHALNSTPCIFPRGPAEPEFVRQCKVGPYKRPRDYDHKGGQLLWLCAEAMACLRPSWSSSPKRVTRCSFCWSSLATLELPVASATSASAKAYSKLVAKKLLGTGKAPWWVFIFAQPSGMQLPQSPRPEGPPAGLGTRVSQSTCS